MTSTVARNAVVPESGEPESDGSSCEERENCKRLLHCDADSSGGKKRRKQTTPVRFPASLTADEREDEEEDEEEEGEVRAEEEEAEEDENEQDDAVEDSGDGRPRAMHRHRASRDEDSTDEFRCRYCARLYEDKEILARHVAAEHEDGDSPSSAARQPSPEARMRVHVKQEPLAASSRSESPVNLTGIGIKSFAATWLAGHAQSHGQQMRSGSSNVEEWTATGPLTSITNHLQTLPFAGSLAQYLPVPSFALTDAGQTTSARAPIGPAPVRIFNPDAYCDLCNKEFCNKYFLKTHKANKHGIYVDTPGQTVAESVAAIGPTSSYVGSFLANSNAKQDGQQQQHGAQLQSHQQHHLPHPHPHHHPHHLLHHHHQQQQQQQQHQQQQRSAGSPSVASISLPPPSVSGTIVLSAVCDLCQKRFKNEDSVRKHKMKVHNAAATDPGLEDCEGSRMLPPPPQHQQQSSNDGDEREGARRSPSPGAMEALFKQEFGVEQEDTGFVPAPRRMSPQSIQQARDSGFSADRLRRLGVVNPEAFCEICCKEYCNKYFLRTHKLKRHGIVVQDSEKSPVNPGAAATWHHVQTSPLNLIVGETSGNGSESGGERPMPDERECKPCGTRFHTAQLYHAHRRKVHEPEEDASPGRENEIDAVSAAEQRTADSISEDLQKLQTMILQLNGLESGRGTACAVCGKEFETRAALRAHTVTEHGAAAMVEEPSTSPGRRGADDSPTPNGASSSVGCTLCEKDFPSHEALRKHLADDHRATTPTSATAAALPSSSAIPVAPTATPPGQQQQQQQQQPERRASISMTPTSSYCEICNKELCNKYFMKTHMQRMHGIEIENGAQIGGVICNICNKELCSKYFLRVHKQNTHRVVEDTAATPSTAAGNNNNNNHNHNHNHNNNNNNNSINNNAAKQADNDHSSGGIDDVALKPEQLGDLSHRYFTHFTEVCPICGRRFRSTKWLKAHLLGDHGKQGVDKWRELEQQYQTVPRGSGRSRGSASHQNPSLRIPNGAELASGLPKTSDYAALGNQVLSTLFGSTDDQQQANTYRCSFCSFSTPVLAFLFVHERSHPGNLQGNAYTAPSQSSGDTEAARTTTTTPTPTPTTTTTTSTTTMTTTTTNTATTTTTGAHQCPVCLQSFSQPELLRHHLLAQHQFPGLISPSFQPSLPGSSRSDSAVDAESSKDPHDADGRIEDAARPSTSPQISISGSSPSNDHLARSQRGEEATAVQVTPQGAYKCAQCGFATANLNRIRKHIKKDHRGASFSGDPTDTVLGELARTLRDVAGKQKLPASYAMPRDGPASTEKTIMQPFLIEESEPAAGASEVSHQEKRFGPALVYLPVRARVNAPLTTSFNLSPA